MSVQLSAEIGAVFLFLCMSWLRRSFNMWEQQFCVPQWAFREEREYGLLHVGVQPDGLLHRFVSVFAG